jgi:hypothetical protein
MFALQLLHVKVRSWHLVDNQTLPTFVRYWGAVYVGAIADGLQGVWALMDFFGAEFSLSVLQP